MPYSSKEKAAEHAAYMKQFRRAQIAKGLCAQCNEPLVPGHTFCERHLQMIRDSTKKKREQRKQAKQCIMCGKPTEIPGRSYCSSCVKRAVHYTSKGAYSGNRLKALARDSHTCRICGRTQNLTVHHIDERGVGHSKPNHSLDNLITLCGGCHTSITKFLKLARHIDVVLALLHREMPS